MSLRNIYMESLIFLLTYISLCAAFLEPENFDTDNEQCLNMNMPDCLDDSSYNDLLVHKSRPTRYNIYLQILFPYWNRVYGIESIIIIVENPIREISLHTYGLCINSQISLKAINISSFKNYVFTGYRYCKQSQILDLQFDKIIVPGIYNLTIYFHVDSFPWKGIIKYEYEKSGTNFVEGRLIIFQSNMARRIFPCWDEPGLKAIFNISVKYFNKFRAFSNMPTTLGGHCDSRACWTYFNDTPLMSPSNVFIALLEDVRLKIIKVETDFFWHTSQIEILKDAIGAIVLVNSYLMSFTNLSILLPRRDHIFFPDNRINSMGCFGLMIYSEMGVLYHENFDFPGRMVYTRKVISHQMARHPFTAVVTQSRWADLWIGESLSKLYSHYIIDKIYSGSQLMDLYAIEILQSTFQYETICQMRALSKYNVRVADEIDVVLCSRWYYNKGFALLRMIEYMMTRDKFQLAVKKYLDEFKFRSATPYDFWIILQRILNNTDNQEFRIKEIMDTWLDQRYYPVMHVFYDPKNNTVRLNITGSDDMRKPIWIIPITYILYHSAGYHLTSDTWITSSEIAMTKIAPNIDFVLFNVEQNGYFRVNYDEESWNRIEIFLHSNNYNKINVLNRAQLIDDAYYFMMQGCVSPFRFWKIVSYLKRDVNYVAWYPMFNILSFMWPIWNCPEVEHIKENLRQMLDGLFENLGYEEEKVDEDNMYKTLRLLATRWACKLGHKNCQAVATRKLSGHLFDPDNNKISPWWKDWVYCAGMISANKLISQTLFKKYKNITDIDILKYLFCSEDAQIIVKYMNEMLLLDLANILLYNDMNELYRIVIKKHIRKDDVLEHIIKNYLKLVTWWLDSFLNIKLLGEMIMNVYLNEHFNIITKFAEDNAYLLKINTSDIYIIKSAQIQRILKIRKIIYPV
ncbi:aminopeptidase Ey-like [Harpegnathos saltator]|uniref:aminopeptidase Ey-like n=1 Tax=Harpegnathos saltator TaxID=610380 RepID=UPI000DBECF3A|nr:aminopeptidase Ey-like [Harpegnathos saltator]